MFVKIYLTVDYTSSDESSYEPDSDSVVPQLQNYKAKHLKWDRTRLTILGALLVRKLILNIGFIWM